MNWDPHITVACVIKKDSKYLIVEEESEGRIVYNQPAGHVDGHETLAKAALREVKEETGWTVRLSGIVGYYAYTSPINHVTYYRVTFAAEAIAPIESAELDPDIIRTHWLSLEEIISAEAQLRSPIVLKSIQDYEQRPLVPLDFIFEHHPPGWLQA